MIVALQERGEQRERVVARAATSIGAQRTTVACTARASFIRGRRRPAASSAARMRGGIGAGRCVSRSTQTWTNRPVAAASSSLLPEDADLVGHRRRSEPHDAQAGVDRLGKRQRLPVAARVLHDVADDRVVDDVEAADADQVLVHHRVEIRVVGDVVDVAVAVVVHPARGNREEMAVVRAPRWHAASMSDRAWASGGSGQVATTARARQPCIRSSRSSTQWRTGRFVPLARCARQPMLAVAMRSGRPASSAASLLAFNSRASSGCSSEYVPDDPQQRCGSATGVSSRPSASRISSTRPVSCIPCCSEHGELESDELRTDVHPDLGRDVRPLGADHFDGIARDLRDPLGLFGVVADRAGADGRSP